MLVRSDVARTWRSSEMLIHLAVVAGSWESRSKKWRTKPHRQL